MMIDILYHFIGFWGRCRRQLNSSLCSTAWSFSCAEKRDSHDRETTKAVEAPRSKQISWLSWLSTEMNDHDLKSQDFPKVRVPWVFSTFCHPFQWLDVGSPAVPSGLLVVLYLLVKAPLPKITGHGSHWQQGRHLGILIHDDQHMGQSLQIPQKNPNLEILSWQKTSAWSIQK